MEFIYEGEKRFRIVFPFDVVVQKGTKIKATNKDEQKRLKELGFSEVKDKTKDGE